MTTVSPETRARTLLVAVVVIWGVSWPVIRVGVSAMPPLWFACLRYAVATACRFVIVGLRGELKIPAAGDRAFVAVSGALQMALYSALTASALTRLPPGRASILAFSTPLWVVPLSVWWLKERGTWRMLAGVGAGLAGVLIIASPALQSGPGHVLAYVQLLGAAAAWAVSIVYVRAHRFRASSLVLAPWQMLVALVLLLPIAIGLEGRWPPLTARAVVALAYVGPIATTFAYWAMVEVGRSVRATTLSMALLVAPGLGLLLSAITMHEAISVSLVVGMILIGTGIRLTTQQTQQTRQTQRAAA